MSLSSISPAENPLTGFLFSSKECILFMIKLNLHGFDLWLTNVSYLSTAFVTTELTEVLLTFYFQFI